MKQLLSLIIDTITPNLLRILTKIMILMFPLTIEIKMDFLKSINPSKNLGLKMKESPLFKGIVYRIKDLLIFKLWKTLKTNLKQ